MWDFIKAYLLFNVTNIGINSNFKLSQQLTQIYNDDQKVRIPNHEGIYDNKKIKLMNWLNIMKVEAILRRFGYPYHIILEHPYNLAIFYVIQHAAIKKKIEYLPLIKAAVLEKALEPKCLAMLEDRIAVWSGRPQKYGTQMGRTQDNKVEFLYPIENPNEVNLLRQKIGLPPLEKNYLK